MTNKFKEKKAIAEILDELYKAVEDKEKSIHSKYEVVGEEQAKDWRTGELRWEDEEKTIPMMVNKYEYVPKSDDELDQDDHARIKACQYVMAQLEKML